MAARACLSGIEALNNWLVDRCTVLWAVTVQGRFPGSIAEVWEVEKPMLMPLPAAFNGFVELGKRVSPTCLMSFDRNRYSVPASFVNCSISLHIYPGRLVIVAKGRLVCEHLRIIERSHRQPWRVIYDWRHDPAGAAIVIKLRSLKMPGMVQAVRDLTEQRAPAFDAAVPMLSQLLKVEMAEREVHFFARHM